VDISPPRENLRRQLGGVKPEAPAHAGASDMVSLWEQRRDMSPNEKPASDVPTPG
jgi:hypothetical protein